jgi:signal transduction histidine kinase/CheY-like chemotaxis protein
MTNLSVDPMEIENRRRTRTWRLAAVELPRLRVAGSVLLSLAVYLNNHSILHAPLAAPIDGWLATTVVVGVYALLSWALLALFLLRNPPVDLTLLMLFGDLPVWTFAIYHSGAEASWLFFILLLRVADQVQTTFRRAVAFAIGGAACYATMLAWVLLVDGRPIDVPAAMTKLTFILFAGIYVSLAARTAETRRARLTESVRVSRDLIRRLEDAHARAEEASAAKSEFVANMSHEMRTPLQGVIGMLQLAIEDDRSEESVRRLEAARRSAETLMAMIDDVLDFSRIEARKLELEPVYFSLRQFVSDTMKSVGVIAAAKRLTLSYIVQGDVADNVWGDPLRLRQILVNLVGNAIKFTHEGEIAVLVSRAGTYGADHRVRFDVRDTGVGIAPALRQRIFEPFTQADSTHARRYGGAGLGLSIVVRLLEAMGGSVDVASDEGAGSVFSFDIPLPSDVVGTTPPRQAWENALVGMSILIVEPAEMARATIKEILRGRGVFASAFARSAEAPAGRFACAVTADPTVQVQPQVLITSPLQHSDHPIQVTRPIGERELIDAIGVALGLTKRAPEFTLEPAFRSQKALRVLLVDDSDVNREVLSEMLRRLGHEATVAADGESALAMLSTTTFDVIFMDVQLPAIDGLEVTRRFRAAGGTTPIIALTAHTSREDRDRCLAAGMNLVVTKPVAAPQLATAIESATRRESIVDVVGGNTALLARVRDAFARQTPELLGGMRDALARGDTDALARHAHKLKGSLSYFPGERGSAIARDIELAAKSGDITRAASRLPELEKAVAELSEVLGRSAGF